MFIGLAIIGFSLPFVFAPLYLPPGDSNLDGLILGMMFFVLPPLGLASLIAVILGVSRARIEVGLRILSALTVSIPLPFLLTAMFDLSTELVITCYLAAYAVFTVASVTSLVRVAKKTVHIRCHDCVRHACRLAHERVEQ